MVGDFAARLPATVIATMLGIPADQHDNVRVWTDQLLTRDAGMMGIPAESDAAVGNLIALSVELMTLRRERPADDILSLLVDVELNGEKLSDAQIIGFCLLLISGGHETTAKLIANGVRLFAAHPEQRDAVIADASLMARAVEELLRYTSPTQYMTRTTTRDVKLHGEVIPQGKKIALLLGSGNRDPREFDRPDEFDIHRGNAADPRVRPRSARVSGRRGRSARSARRARGVSRAFPQVRRRRTRYRVHAFWQRARADKGAGHRALDARFRRAISLHSRLHVGVAESADALA